MPIKLQIYYFQYEFRVGENLTVGIGINSTVLKRESKPKWRTCVKNSVRLTRKARAMSVTDVQSTRVLRKRYSSACCPFLRASSCDRFSRFFNPTERVCIFVLLLWRSCVNRYDLIRVEHTGSTPVPSECLFCSIWLLFE